MKTVEQVVKQELKPWQLDPKLLAEFDAKGYFLIADETIAIAAAHPMYAYEVASLMCKFGDGALVNADNKQEAHDKVLRHIADGLGFVALAVDTGEVIGYQGVTLWPTIPIAEPGAAVTNPEYRGRGVNSAAKKLAITKTVQTYPERDVLFFTEEKSKSRGIVQKLGVKEVPLDEVKSLWPDLAEPCPAACYMKCGHQCGCQVFTLNR